MVEENNKIILTPNKFRFFRYLFLFLLPFGFSVFMFVTASIDGKVTGGGISLLMSLAVLWYLTKIRIGRPILTLTTEGVFINYLSKEKRRLILWGEITRIEKFTQIRPAIGPGMLIAQFFGGNKQKYLVIYTDQKDPTYNQEEYGTDRMDNVSKGRDTNLYVPSQYFSMKVDDILAIFRKYTDKVG